nr:hypothetical protein [Tanacetum cinerariifolium]
MLSLVIVEDKGSSEKGGSTANQVSTARPKISTASVPVNVGAATLSIPPTTTTTIFGNEDLTIAQTLIKLRTRIDADHELAVRLIHEEQGKYTIEERERLLAGYFERRKKQLAAERAEAIKNKPPTRTKVRIRMITYLKHIEPKSKDKKGKRIKRVADSALKQKYSKKQKMMQEQESAKSDEEESAYYEHENEELRMWLTVVSDE